MILERYLFREVFLTFVAVLAVLALVYLGDGFVRYLKEAAAGKVSAEMIMQMLVLKLAAYLVVLLPLAFYIAVLLGFGRLYRDSEIVAMEAGGISPIRLAEGISWLVVSLVVIAAGLSLYLAPKAAALLEDLIQKSQQQSEMTGIYPGRFKEYGNGEHVLFVQDIARDRRRMNGVFLRVRDDTKEDIVVAESARQWTNRKTGERFIILDNGYRYHGTPGEVNYVVMQFGSYAMRIDPARGPATHYHLESLPTLALFERNDLPAKAELQRRLSLPLSVLLLGTLAVPLSRTSPSQGRYAKLVPAILLYFIYINALSIAENLIERGDLTPSIGVWPVHGVLALLCVALLYARSSHGVYLRRLRRRLGGQG